MAFEWQERHVVSGDQVTADELKLFTENDGDIYRSQTLPILKNLTTKKARGVYKHDLAVKLFMYLAERGAKDYAREHGGGMAWHQMFSVPVRKIAAKEWADEFETEYENGEYDHLLPKKYQKKK
jgi:hypothetical protein